jgi:hypothetical protein
MATSTGAIGQLSGLFASPTSSTNTPGVVPSSTALPGSSPTASSYGANSGAYYSAGGDVPGTNSSHIIPTEDPTLTQQFDNMLSGQVGQGLPAFDLSTLLPSSGQATAAGTLNAPLNSTDQAIQAFLAGGSTSTPGANQLTQMAQTGDPVNQTPAWQAMIASQQQNTAVGANNLREQFAGTGSLSSSPFATSMQQYYNQNTENQNAQLTAATTAEGDAAASRALTAQQGIQSEAGTFGQQMQTLDQQSIQNMLNEFNYTLPQNNPLISTVASAASMQPSTTGTPTTMQNLTSFLNSLGQLF